MIPFWIILTFNLHFQETFFVSLIAKIFSLTWRWSFNLHFQETFFVSFYCGGIWNSCDLAFNLHFQETFFVSLLHNKHSQHRFHLSISIFRRLSLFLKKLLWWRQSHLITFNLHFQETFFVSNHLENTQKVAHSSFNLHFQETFFVSSKYILLMIFPTSLFQSPFSGDFLCFLSLLSHAYSWRRLLLSISIFRRLSLFLII